MIPIILSKILSKIDLVLMLGGATYIYTQYDKDIITIIGLIIALVGFVLWGISRLQLGNSFSIDAQAKGLVTTGIYSKIRHPIYIFGGLSYLGLFIASKQPVAMICFFIIYLTYQSIRIKNEETILDKTFGSEYQKYRKNTWC